MATQVHIVFYSMYGHIYRMAEAVAEGARQVSDVEVSLFQVQELVPEEALVRTGAKEARQQFAHIPYAQVDLLPQADALIFGTPTRFGNMAAQMRNFLDQTSRLWLQGALNGKVGSVFSSTASQHGGQESTILTFWPTLAHLGLIIVGTPYTEDGRLIRMDEITGGTPYGASTIAGADGSRAPSENELAIARFQGSHVAGIAKKLTAP